MRPSAPATFGRIKAHPPHAAPGQAIGLLGGSFNPPHAAHRMISEVALKRLGLDKVWWIVSPGNPLKKRSDTAPLPERLVLCREVAKNPHIVVTDFEADLQTPYTASTLAFLKMRNPLVRYVWIMGADNLASFDRWQRWREIFTMVPIVVVDRPGWRLKALGLQGGPGLRRGQAARDGGRRPGPSAGARLDLPHGTAVPRVLDGAQEQGAAPQLARCQKSTGAPSLRRQSAGPRVLKRVGLSVYLFESESPRGTGFARKRAVAERVGVGLQLAPTLWV